MFAQKAKEEIGSDVAVKTSRGWRACSESVAADGKAPLAVGCRRWSRGPALPPGGPQAPAPRTRPPRVSQSARLLPEPRRDVPGGAGDGAGFPPHHSLPCSGLQSWDAGTPVACEASFIFIALAFPCRTVPGLGRTGAPVAGVPWGLVPLPT